MTILKMLILIFVVGAVACNPFSSDHRDLECDTSFLSVNFRVVDAVGSPQTGLRITVTNQRTGEVYDVRQPNHEPGVYSALDDSFRDEVRKVFGLGGLGEPIHVNGIEGDREFDADFVIASSECHIRKISGPDSVIVQAP